MRINYWLPSNHETLISLDWPIHRDFNHGAAVRSRVGKAAEI